MASRVAVLSDVHGVLPVLEAVLDEPDVADADLIVVSGDHASGPQPVEVLDRLAALGERVLLVCGNADRELVALRRGEEIDIPDEVTPWAAQQLRADQVELLAGLPHPVTVEIDGFGWVLFCHGTPRDDDEVVLVDTRHEKWQEVLADVPAQVRTVVCGHTHMPFVRLVNRRLVVNLGSIGMPLDILAAHGRSCEMARSCSVARWSTSTPPSRGSSPNRPTPTAKSGWTTSYAPERVMSTPWTSSGRAMVERRPGEQLTGEGSADPLAAPWGTALSSSHSGFFLL